MTPANRLSSFRLPPCGVAVFLWLVVVAADAGVSEAAATNSSFAAFFVYEDGDPWRQKGAPSGWMGDYRDLSIDQRWPHDVHSGKVWYACALADAKAAVREVTAGWIRQLGSEGRAQGSR